MSNKHQNNSTTLWMGDIDESMDERFIKTSFNLVGVDPTHVKVVRNKTNGQPMGYGFISFDSEETAQMILQEMNGKLMPNSTQGKKFRLNTTSNREEVNEFSIYVGDLSPEVDDSALLNAFGTHYPSVCSAKVIVSEGMSRRFGFVRFTQESDYRNALTQTHNSNILGPKPISVRAAKPRRNKSHNNYNYQKPRSYDLVGSPETYVPQPSTEASEQVYGSEVNPYYNVPPAVGQPLWVYPMMPYNALPMGYDPYAYGQQALGQQTFYQNCDNMTYSLIPGPIYVDHGHNQFMDDKLNDEMIAKNEDLYASIESTRWSSPIDAEKEPKLQ